VRTVREYWCGRMEHRNRPPLHPIWYLIGWVVLSFVAGLVIKLYREGSLF
jgi:hypothetical protein